MKSKISLAVLVLTLFFMAPIWGGCDLFPYEKEELSLDSAKVFQLTVEGDRTDAERALMVRIPENADQKTIQLSTTGGIFQTSGMPTLTAIADSVSSDEVYRFADVRLFFYPVLADTTFVQGDTTLFVTVTIPETDVRVTEPVVLTRP